MKHILAILLGLTILISTESGLWGETHSNVDIQSHPELSLEAAFQITLAENPTLAAAQERIAAAGDRLDQARSAYFPILDATAAASRVNLSENDYQLNLQSARLLNPLATIEDPEAYYQTGLTARWLLFNGFERRFTYLRAKYGEAESRQARQEVARVLLDAVARAYFNAQLAKETVAIAQANEDFNRRLAKEAELRRQAGTGSLSDVLNFEVQVNSAKAALIGAKEAKKQAMAGLAALMGVKTAAFPKTLILAELDPVQDRELEVPDAALHLKFALAHRPDLQQNDLALKGAEAGVRIAQADYFPDIALVATVDGDRSGDADFSSDDFGDAIALNLSFNLFSGGLTKARVSEAKNNLRAARKSYEAARLNVSAEVQQAVAGLTAAQEQLILQRENAKLTKKNRDLVEKEYSVGQASLVRLNEAQRDLVRAQALWAQARVSLRRALYSLDVTTGRSIEKIMNSN